MPRSKPTFGRCSAGTAGGASSAQGGREAVRRPGIGARGALVLIRVYKVLLSPLFTGSCRFVPSCSEYTAEAIRRYGLLKGCWLGVKRLGRCHPLCEAGYDPVPDRAIDRTV